MVIFPVTYRQILDDPEAQILMSEYAWECSMPELGDVNPQRELYQAMEDSGGLKSFGVYKEDKLIGFATLLIYVLPHYGKKIATTESIFIAIDHRNSVAGARLLSFLEDYAKGQGCEAFLYTAPEGSRFSALLSIKDEYRHSNNVFVRGL